MFCNVMFNFLCYISKNVKHKLLLLHNNRLRIEMRMQTVQDMVRYSLGLTSKVIG